MSSNLTYPYATAEKPLKPKYKILNSSNLKISSNSINFFDDPDLNKLELEVSIDLPEDIEWLIEKHENVKNATKCVIQIISRQSMQRKEIILENNDGIYKGVFEIKRRDFVDTTNLKSLIVRDKFLKERKTKNIAYEKGAILAFAENDLVINFKKTIFSKGMPIIWEDFSNPSLNIENYQQDKLFYLEIDGPDNYPILYFNEKHKHSGIEDIIKTEDKNNAKSKNKELLHSFIYIHVMSRLLIYVLNKLERQKFETSEYNNEQNVLIDNLDRSWQKELILDFAMEFFPGAENLQNSSELIEKTIEDGNIDELIKKIDLVTQSKKKFHNKIINYYDYFKENFHKTNGHD